MVSNVTLSNSLNVSRYIQVRTFNLRDTRAMRDLNPSDIDKMVAIRGMVTRCTSIIPDLKMAFFKCLVCGEAPELTFVDRGQGASIYQITLVRSFALDSTGAQLRRTHVLYTYYTRIIHVLCTCHTLYIHVLYTWSDIGRERCL